MTETFFTIECKTNLHVGSGKANYGVVDQLVQRDPTYQYPTIHASSLKGAIKEYCHHIKFTNMVQVFGSDKGNDGKTMHDSSQIGTHKFFDANLLAIPVRCDKKAFIHITCPNIINWILEQFPGISFAESLKKLAGIFEDEGAPVYGYSFAESLDKAVVEDFDIQATYNKNTEILLTDDIKKLFKYDFVILQNKWFDRLTDDMHLPVIARNYLENGESKNLWYEQVVPRLTRFWSMFYCTGQDDLFVPNIFKENTLIQIGANGSIGYGYCSFLKYD